MARRLPTLSLLLAALLTCCVASAEGPLREAASANKRFQLRLRPGRPGTDALRGCRATLLEQGEREHRTRKCWERFLVNDVCPEVALISDDGRYVVTLDEYRVGGARHALAIYGDSGSLLRHFLLPDLLGPGDWRYVKVQKRSIDWLRGAKYAFVDSPPQFVITFEREREIRIDLKTLRVVRDGDAAAAPSTEIPPEILALLFGEPGPEDASAELTEQPPAEPGEEVTKPEVALVEEEAEAPVDADAETELAAAQEPEAVMEKAEALEEYTPPEAIVTPSGMAVPWPDPAHPADYLAWANEMTFTDGPNAGPEFEAAIDSIVQWAGDSELYLAAERGDAAALADPLTQQYLDANYQAITLFRNAGQLDFNGWELHSEDGSMLTALLPNLSPMRQLAKLTVMDGKRLASEGFADGAAASYADTLAAGACMARGTTLIENLVGVAVQALASQALLDLPASPASEELDYSALAERLATAGPPPRPLEETLQVERAMFLDSLQRSYHLDPATGTYTLDREWASVLSNLTGEGSAVGELQPTLGRDDYARTVQDVNALYDAVSVAVTLPYQEAQAQMALLEAQLAADPTVNPVMKTLVPSFSRVHTVQARGESCRRAATLVTELMAYRQLHGVLPASLEALGAGTTAVDPFSGQPFRYRLDGDDFVLYTVGANGTDEGGVHDKRFDTNDHVFWPRPD